MSTATPTFHGILGDLNPIEHDGAVVYTAGGGVEVLNFKGWHDDEGPRVSVSRFPVGDNVLSDLSWAEWGAVASYIGMPEDELKELAGDERILARAQVYLDVAAYHGFVNLDSSPQELTLAEAEEQYGKFVDEAHAAPKRMMRDAYDDGECPDCGEQIPSDAEEGSDCSNCGHVFWSNPKVDDEPIVE
jgi:hypothetical protein